MKKERKQSISVLIKFREYHIFNKKTVSASTLTHKSPFYCHVLLKSNQTIQEVVTSLSVFQSFFSGINASQALFTHSTALSIVRLSGRFTLIDP